ncbi:MAG: GerMN domain-containing protein, partial [Spirochaetota bacterium]
NEKTEKTYLHPVFRTVSATTPVKSSIEELIKGPSPSEKNRGLLTAVHSDIKLYDVTISGNTAILNFNSAIEYGATGNILLSRIDQIIYTATQFDNIDNIIIKINGKTRRFLGSDGIAVGGPLHRR